MRRLAFNVRMGQLFRDLDVSQPYIGHDRTILSPAGAPESLKDEAPENRVFQLLGELRWLPGTSHRNSVCHHSSSSFPILLPAVSEAPHEARLPPRSQQLGLSQANQSERGHLDFHRAAQRSKSLRFV